MSLEVSDLWRSLCGETFAGVDDAFLEGFRRPGGPNSRLAAWDPLDKSMRYFKFLLYAAATRQPERFFSLYRALGNVDLGQPITVSLHSCEINIDYLLSVDEYLFVESVPDFRSVQSIVEIGAGFGRTCHAFLALSAPGQVQQYTIVDLPEILELSRRALAKLIPKHYEKVRFVDATREGDWHGIVADLAINIDSFQEMPPATIDSYMSRLVSGSRLFYVKNPIAKYDPNSVGIRVENSKKMQDVLSLGYCRNVIDIFNDAALGSAREIYINAYRPAAAWQLIADRALEIFPYYHHALYRR